MKTTFAAAASALLALSTSAVAQSIQSKPFFLITYSQNKKYNNASLGACHEGAAIEGLCAGTPDAPLNATSGYSTYAFNTTQAQTTANVTGVLTYGLKATSTNGPVTDSEALTFFHDPSTNVALPLFEPSYGVAVGFNAKNELFVPSALNDQATPPTFNSTRQLLNWYVCETNFEGYVYETLAFVTGVAKPQNPSCVKVSVVRKFV